MKNAEEVLKEKGSHLICVTPDTTIQEALQTMIDNKIGAILVKEQNNIVGIWTERDLMRNTLSEGFNPGTAQIGDYMSTDLQFAPHTDSIYMLKDKFLGMRLRHLLIKKGKEYIGLLSIGDIIKTSLNEKTQELDELNAIMKWDYYENWKWKKKGK